MIPGVTKVGFTEGIFLGYVDPDFNAQGWQAQWILPLAESEPDRVVRTVTLPVPDAVSDGLYTFTCTITRFP